MKVQRKLTILVLTITLLLSSTSTSLAVPPFPSRFWGTVKVNGTNVPFGTIISAWIDSCLANVDGDDAIELFQSGAVVDVFGDISVDGTGEAWEYMDGWAYRVDETGPDGNTFVLANWIFSGPNALDGETTNATATTPFPIGTYSPITSTTTDLLITGVIDGPLSGDLPKAIELYVINDIADLGIYGLGSANDGGGTDGEEFTFPAVAATAGTFMYVVSESPQFIAFFEFPPDYTSHTKYVTATIESELWNGDTVYTLGVPGEDPEVPGIQGGMPGDIVVFHIGDYIAEQTGIWQNDPPTATRLDLTYTGASEIDIAKTPDTQTVVGGSDVSFTITVTNTGDLALDNVTVTDGLAPDCDASLASLLATESTSYTCTVASVTIGFTNTAVVTSTPWVGDPVTGTGTARVDVINPSIEITKEADQIVLTGSDVNFTITVTNTGDLAFDSVTVVDALAPNCDASLASLAARGHTSYTCTVASVTADFSNTAVVTGTPWTGIPVTGTGTARVDVIAPSIEITKEADQTVLIASDVNFTITVTNTGDVTLDSVTVTDILFPDCGAGLGSLTAKESTSYTCTVVSATTDFTNTAVVTGTPPVGHPVTGTDTARVDVTDPSIGITKEADQIVLIGSDVSFTITVTNTGDVTLDDVIVTDLLAPGCGAGPSSLAAEETTSYTCTVASVTADFTNTAVVTATPWASDPVTSTDTARVDVINPSIGITKQISQSIEPGSAAIFTITVENTGDATLDNVTVVDTLVPDCDASLGSMSVAASESYTCTLANVMADFSNSVIVTGTPPVGAPVTGTDTADVDVIVPAIEIIKEPDQAVLPGSAATFTITVTNTGNYPLNGVTVWDEQASDCNANLASFAVEQSTSYTCTITNVLADFVNTAFAFGIPLAGDSVTDMDTAEVDVIVPSIDIAKEADQTVLIGSAAIFTITVENTGDATLDNVTVVDASTPDCDADLASLVAAETTSYTCTVASVMADFSNTALVTGTPPAGDPVTDTDTASVHVEPAADLSVTTTDSHDPADAGAPLTYTLTVVNDGPSDATGVTLTDGLPVSTTFSSATSSQGNCSGTGTVICNLTNLSNGATATVTIIVTPTTAGTLVNTASVMGNETDLNTDNNTATENTTVVHSAPPTSDNVIYLPLVSRNYQFHSGLVARHVVKPSRLSRQPRGPASTITTPSALTLRQGGASK